MNFIFQFVQVALYYTIYKYIYVSAGPHLSSLGRIFRDHDIGTQ